MKHKNFLLITFFLTLFVFQQVQAGTTIQSTKNPSQDSFAPPHAPLDNIYVFVLALTSGNTIDYSITGQPYKCLYAYQYPGCGIIDPESPTAPRNPVEITVDPYYLRDVITIEMNVGEIPPTEQELPALKAQAIAARTVASWKFANAPFLNDNNEFFEGVRGINNSTQYQVFIPGSYEDFPAAQDLIDQAINETQGQFLSYEPDGSHPDGSRKTIDAEFSSDIIPQSAYGNQGYLQIIQEPISSSTCTVQGTVGNNWGMSQRGAIRWAIGNTCPDESGTDWPVTWSDYRQILAHYYTGVDILNGSGGKVAPDDRWNLLWHNNFGSPIGTPPTLTSGTPASIQLNLQNTSSASTPVWGDMELGYQWVSPAFTSDWQLATIGAGNIIPPLPVAGNPPSALGQSTGQFTATINPPATSGTYTLHLDLRRHVDGQGINAGWFSIAGWPDAQIVVTVTTPAPTPSLEFVDWNLNLYTGTGGNQPCDYWNIITCSAVVTSTQTNPDRLDFDITYNYNDSLNFWGSRFYVDIRMKNVLNTDLPIYWEVTGDTMPGRWIETQYSGAADYGDTANPIATTGNWIVPSQPSAYDKFTFHFVRYTDGPEILTRTDTWHLTIATYDFRTSTPTPTLTPTSTLTPTPNCSSIWEWLGCKRQDLQNWWQDTFNTPNGSIGGNWGGDTGGYSVSSNALDVAAGSNIILWQTSYGADQFAFITMTNVDENGGEQSLVLKSQSPTSTSSGGIEVVYDAANHVVRVMTSVDGQVQTQHGGDIPVTFVDGDQFIARARPDGMVEIYLNDQLLGTRDITAWSYYAGGGYTGLSFVGAGDAVLDDFGGGTVPTDPTPTPTNTPSPTPTFTPTNTPAPTPTFTPTALPLVASSVTRANPNPTAAASVDFTVTFSEPVTGVDANDFTLTSPGVSNAAISGVAGSGNSYTVTVNTGYGDGDLRLDVADDDTIVNAAGNPLGGMGIGNGGFTSGESYTISKAPSVLSSLRTNPDPTKATTAVFTVTFSENVTGVNAADFNLTVSGITGASVGAVSGSGRIYTVTVGTGSGSGTIRLNVADDDSIKDATNNPLGGTGAGNGGFTSGEVYTIDKAVPTVSSSRRANPNPSPSASVDFTVTFSESVTGVNTTDFSLTTSGISGATVSGVSGTGNVYTVTVNTGTGNGTIRLNVADDDTIKDAATNPLGGAGASNGNFTTGETYTIDRVPTVLSITRASTDPSKAATVNFTVTFSESVTGVNIGDFTLTTSGVSGAAVSTVSGAGSTYTVTVNTGTGDGTIRLDVMDDDTIKDAANNLLGGAGTGNGNFTGGASYTIDKTVPTVVSSVLASANPTSAASVNFTVTFSETVTGVNAADFNLTTSGISGASVSSVSGSGNTYTVTVSTGTGSGTLRLNVVDDDTIKDMAANPLGGTGAGNGSFTSGPYYTIDKAAPTVVSSLRTDPSPTTAPSINFTVTFSEVVMGVNTSDFSLTTSGVTGASISGVNGSGSTYTVTVLTGTGSGTIRLNVVDDDTIKDALNNPLGGAGAGNGNFTGGSTYTMDRTGPTVTSIARTNTNPTSAANVNFTVTFSESVTGVDITDFNLTTVRLSGAIVNGVSGSGTTYTVTVFTGSGNGSIRLNVADDDTIKDALLNPLGTGFTSGETYTVIKTATFADVPLSHWANSWIERAYNAGVVSGCSNSPLNYCPDVAITRDQIAVVLLRGIHGAGYTPPPVGASTGFSDVPVSHWAAAWIKQLAAEGITAGCGSGMYCPSGTANKAEIAVFLLRSKHGSSYTPPAVGVSTGFADVPVNHWAAAWIKQLAAEGITSGCGSGNYCPNASVTRAEMAAFLVKTFNLP